MKTAHRGKRLIFRFRYFSCKFVWLGRTRYKNAFRERVKNAYNKS